jgi:nitrogen-specific signal transduction histidine kinase/CheY-like chemotaxis protein
MRVSIIRDVTEQLRLEAEQRALAERVRHAQKHESHGILAGGVAHDFNNILTVITNAVALARRGGPSAVTQLDTISLAAARAAELCRQMLAYAGKTALVREPVDLSSLVAEMSAMLEVSVAKKATIARELTPALPAIVGDATQIRQVVMNLVLNAAEAIAATSRSGVLAIATGAGTYDAEALARSAAGGEPRPGRYVWVEVEDDGVGMDEPTSAQMFDPFFTTKFMGRGLGMAAVLGIVRAHAGAVEVQSRLGEGTSIRVLFPAALGATAAPKAPRPSVELRGRGVVLLVDDEENVRISSQLLLEGLGFEVISARDGNQAIERFLVAAGRIDVVLLDLTMPGMDGVATLAALRRIDPDVRVVLTTGYGALRREDWPTASGPPPDAVLAKPYAEEMLLATLLGTMRSRPSNLR